MSKTFKKKLPIEAGTPRKYELTDYHDFCGPDSTKAHCDRLNVGEYYINAVECSVCGYYVRSRNRHDMVTCKCGNVSVDGGSHYLKRSFQTDNFIDRSILFDWAKEQNMVG